MVEILVWRNEDGDRRSLEERLAWTRPWHTSDTLRALQIRSVISIWSNMNRPSNFSEQLSKISEGSS
jgi:hypothetical protein